MKSPVLLVLCVALLVAHANEQSTDNSTHSTSAVSDNSKDNAKYRIVRTAVVIVYSVAFTTCVLLPTTAIVLTQRRKLKAKIVAAKRETVIAKHANSIKR